LKIISNHLNISIFDMKSNPDYSDIILAEGFMSERKENEMYKSDPIPFRSIYYVVRRLL